MLVWILILYHFDKLGMDAGDQYGLLKKKEDKQK